MSFLDDLKSEILSIPGLPLADPNDREDDNYFDRIPDLTNRKKDTDEFAKSNRSSKRTRRNRSRIATTHLGSNNPSKMKFGHYSSAKSLKQGERMGNSLHTGIKTPKNRLQSPSHRFETMQRSKLLNSANQSRMSREGSLQGDRYLDNLGEEVRISFNLF